MQWYRLQEEEELEPCLSQHLLSDNESDDDHSTKPSSVSRPRLSGIRSSNTGNRSQKRGGVGRPPLSGIRKRIGSGRDAEITEETDVRLTSSETRSEKTTPRYSSRITMADAETQTTSQSVGNSSVVGVSRSAISLDELWRRFLELQISGMERAGRVVPGRVCLGSSYTTETRKSMRSQLDAEFRGKRSDPKLVAQYEVTPSAVAVERKGKLNPIAFDISPGIPQGRFVSHRKTVPSLQAVTLQEAFLQWKPMFAVHVKERQKAVQVKRETRFRNKGQAWETKPCANENPNRGHVWPLAERLYRAERRHIRRKEAVEQTKRLYQQLPEVKAKQLSDKRRVQCQTNRLRAALYGQEVRQRLLKSAR